MAYKFDDPREFPFRDGGLFLGLDDKGHEIGVTTERHALTIGGAGAGKGAALLVPNARRWPHSLLVIDPKGENAALSWESRQEKGQAVYVLDPFKIADVPDDLRASFNPLAGIVPANVSAREDIEVIADGMVRRDNKEHAQWDDGAVMVLAGVIAYVVENAPPDRRNLTSVRAVLMQENAALYENAQRMMDAHAFGGLARAAGVAILTGLDSSESMEADFINSARRHSKWIDSPAMGSVLDQSTFDLAEIKTGNASVFLVLPPHYIQTHAAFLRLFVRCGINAMAAGGSGKGGRCLFLLDEFYALGKIEEIAKAAGLMRSYGVHLWPFLQDLGQLQDLYGATGAETFFGNADAVTFLGNTDTLTLRYASEKIGMLTPAEIRNSAPPQTVVEKQALAVIQPQPYERGRKRVRPYLPFSRYETEADYARRLAKMDEKRQRTHEVAHDNAREYASKKDAEARATYEHAMRQVGMPRVPPDKLAALVGKGDGDAVARSMVAFLPRGKVVNLRPAPYFRANPTQPMASPSMGRNLPPKGFQAGLASILSLIFAAIMVVGYTAHLLYAATLPSWLYVVAWLAIMAGVAVMPPLWPDGEFDKKNYWDIMAAQGVFSFIIAVIIGLISKEAFFYPLFIGSWCLTGLAFPISISIENERIRNSA